MTPEYADSIALQALQYLAGDTELLSQFFALTGMAPDDLRQTSGTTEFKAGLLDFYLSNEPALIAFSANCDIAPEDIQKARFQLQPPSHTEGW